MGLLITKVYRWSVQMPHMDETGLDAYSHAWREVLAHPDVGLLKSKVVEGKDVLIAEDPIHVAASSAYAVVAYLTWSKFNSDFTEESRTMFQGKSDAEILEKIKSFQHRTRPIIALYITKPFFPELFGIEYGVNLWPMQQANSTFVAA